MPMYKRSLMILLLIVCVGGGAAMYGYAEQEEEISLDAAEQVPEVAQAKIMVYVTGAVNRPGLAELPEDSRLADAVNACGGVLPTADMEQVNMAQKLKDGQQVRIAERKEGETQKNGSGEGASEKKGTDSSGRINLNQADEKQLDSLPGIGPAMAKRIIEYRNQEGLFQSTEDLKKIKGIGDAKYEKLKDKVTV